jgi:hypothetical protein
VRIQAEAQVVRVEPSFPDKAGCGFAVVSVTGFNFASSSVGDVKVFSSVNEKLEEVGERPDE